MTYIPNRGDIIWLQFSPQEGHEQAGRRPSLVLSPYKYNKVSRIAIVCPITSKIKGYPFEVILPKDIPVKGVILSGHIRSVDYEERGATYICSVSNTISGEVLGKLTAILED